MVRILLFFADVCVCFFSLAGICLFMSSSLLAAEFLSSVTASVARLPGPGAHLPAAEISSDPFGPLLFVAAALGMLVLFLLLSVLPAFFKDDPDSTSD